MQIGGDRKTVAPLRQANVNAMRVNGESLPGETRQYFEPRFGYDFSNVRVHYDSPAAKTAKAVNARAFTIGSHIVFGDGEFSPNTNAGKRLIAHELAHVVQQDGAAGNQKKLLRKPATSDCTTTDIAELNAAFPVALAMVRKAIRVIGSTPSTPINRLLRKYFNDDSVSTRLHALIGYQNLLSGMTGSFTIECEHLGSFMYDYFCGGTYAYVRALAGLAGNVHICELAFGRSVNDLAETIIHECSHKFDNTDDEEYCWGGCPASLGRWDAYDNADSFSKFAWEAYTTIP